MLFYLSKVRNTKKGSRCETLSLLSFISPLLATSAAARHRFRICYR